MASLRTLAIAVLASSALARTDLAGCTYTDLVIKPTQMAPYASRLYYVPDTGEVCAFLDCGGGRAPPKTTVPGCPLYKGTETYAPSYIDPKTLGNGVIEAGSSVAVATAPVTASSSAASAAESSSAAATATATTEASVTILTGTNTTSSSSSRSSAASSAQVTSASSSAASKTEQSGSSSAAKTTSPSTAAGAMQTVGAVLGPCVMAAIAAGLA